MQRILLFLFIFSTVGSKIPTSVVLSPISDLTYPTRALFLVTIQPPTINRGLITFYNHGVTPLGNVTITSAVAGGIVRWLLNNTHAGKYVVTANYTDKKGTYHSSNSSPRTFTSLPATVYLNFVKLNGPNSVIYANQTVVLTVNLTTAKGQGPYHTTVIATWNNSVFAEWNVNLTQHGHGIQYKTFTKIHNFSVSFPTAGVFPFQIATAKSQNYRPGLFARNLTVKAKDCGAFPVPDNATSTTCSDTHYPNSCSFTCNTGYSLTGGSGTGTCGGDGTWSPLGTCTKDLCCAPGKYQTAQPLQLHTPDFASTQSGMTADMCCQLCRDTPSCVQWALNNDGVCNLYDNSVCSFTIVSFGPLAVAGGIVRCSDGCAPS